LGGGCVLSMMHYGRLMAMFMRLFSMICNKDCDRSLNSEIFEKEMTD
jgi:hypothetical protein